MFGVKNIYSGLLALPQVIITISHRKSALENEIYISPLVLVYCDTSSFRKLIWLCCRHTLGLLK